MTNETDTLAKLIAACWKDEALKARFISDPVSVLAEYGMNLPEGIDVNVVENTDETIHITLPTSPEGVFELSDDELEKAAGGLWDPNFICTGWLPCPVNATFHPSS